MILAHPRAHSLNHAIAGSAAEQLRANGHTVLLHDLYAEGFLPMIGADEAKWGDCIFGPCGVQTYARRVFSVVATSSPTSARPSYRMCSRPSHPTFHRSASQ